MIRSPSWWPGTSRPSTSGGRCPIGTAPMILPRVSRRPRRRARPSRPDRRHALQLPAQPAARVHVDRLVDRLVADPHRRVVRVQSPSASRWPARVSTAVQHGSAPRPAAPGPGQPGRLGPPLPLPGQPVRPLGLVAAGPRVGVAGQLPADRRRAAAQPRRDLPHRQARPRAAGPSHTAPRDPGNGHYRSLQGAGTPRPSCGAARRRRSSTRRPRPPRRSGSSPPPGALAAPAPAPAPPCGRRRGPPACPPGPPPPPA